MNLIHSYYKPVCLGILVFLGLSCGHLIDTVLQMKLRVPGAFEPAAGPSAPDSATKVTAADLNLILQSNLFDANNRSDSMTMNLDTDHIKRNQTDKVTPRVDLKLIGTVVANDESLALIEAKKELKIYALGDEVPGGGTLEEIERTRVQVRNQDQSLTNLVLHEQGSASHINKRVDAIEPVVSGTIKAVGENRWVVSKDMVESVRENFSTQLRLAQMQPRLVDGKTDGFLVQRIYPRSVLAKMGLKRGDVVVNVNNIKLDSPEKALQIFQQLREARRIAVGVERDGNPVSFVYEIE